MRTRVAFFPLTTSTCAMLENFEELQSEYAITHIIAPAGCSVIGKDASELINGKQIEITVEDDLNEQANDWDALMLAETAEDTPWLMNVHQKLIDRATELGKQVICVRREKDLDEIETGNCKVIFGKKFYDNKKIQNVNKVRQILTPAILVCGLLEEADVFAVLLRIACKFRSKGVRTVVLTKQPVGALFGFFSYTHIIENHDLTEAEKIEALNHYASDLENRYLPDVFLIEAPDAALMYNRYAPNGFGIRTYMMAQAVTLDASVFCIPCEYSNSDFLKKVDAYFSARLNCKISAVHVSNVIVDSFETKETNRMSLTRTAASRVKEYLFQIKDEFPTFNFFDEADQESFSNLVCAENDFDLTQDIRKKSENLTEAVIKILHEKFRVPTENLSPEFWEAPLTSDKFAFSTQKLVVLFFEIEKRFNIRIPESILENYGFLTIGKIIDAVKSSVSVDDR